ncbi:BamA/TamA family outer membrane protein [Moraxella bovis]|uniref:autotransporter assembly complex protein TamA n=1 Tax=Moraxella bovis TaxID=476 RepID=UPI002225D13B|nr:BamA/TamA family outer membrane protein [Moraxella bovis]UYZ69584.1 BamA/TamA family outer membrane protein [Moraxella bovis]UYZ71955.1 BamA/TamA family outer membrane protein [Moraxella bovis]UYZ72134.1 BamA/TamA family outer membrane protein [Moraxella bovis]UZA15256.1 BamA/TamA family outer membrane protein [Moraxella bovis]UZA26389.1 BamA/TamA family outer membrane protein [Moraxella bovis]
MKKVVSVHKKTRLLLCLHALMGVGVLPAIASQLSAPLPTVSPDASMSVGAGETNNSEPSKTDNGVMDDGKLSGTEMLADGLPDDVFFGDMSASQMLTAAEIEKKLQDASMDNRFYETADVSHADTRHEDGFAKIEDGDIATLGTDKTPIGLDESAITKLPTYESVTAGQDETEGELDPTAYLPEYEYEANTPPPRPDAIVDEIKPPNLVKRLYSRLFNDGVEAVTRLKVNVYHGGERVGWDTAVESLDDFEALRAKMMARRMNNAKATDNADKVARKTLKSEPFANIVTALEEISAESVADFGASVARLRQTVITAGQAVGYYDLNFSIERAGAGEINLVMHDLGEPVVVDNAVLDVRGLGADDPAYVQAQDNAPLKQGDVFHHGNYEANKAVIDEVSGEHGYFDGRWLSNSVDVILPDNVADVNLVYDTGEQYRFDDVVFFTVDKDTGQLTTDPDKLPVKPEVLRKLVTFEMGDAYNRTATRNLSNNLLATGYFNAVNTEIVPPSQTPETGINFENTTARAETDDGSQTVDLGDGVTATIDPIDFTTSEIISDKLALVKQKAERLYNAPDDRLLVTDSSKQSRSILGRISDAVSSVAKMILPDESSDVLPELPEGVESPVLAGRKGGQDVYEDKKVPLYIFVMSDKPRDAQIGVGWGSDNGARLITKIEHNLLNRDGMQAGADVRVSQNKKGVEMYITRPMSHPLNDKVKASLGYDEEKIDQGVGHFDLSSKTLETGLSRNIIKENGWNRTYSLRYRLDELETNAPRETWQDLPVQFEGGKPTQEALLLGYAMNKMVVDNLANPMRGYRQYYSLELGKEGLLADTDMAILRAGLSGVYSFGDNSYGKDRQHQLISSLNLGYLWADDFNAVPYKLRFFAGGDQSIRGYNYESLSPLSDKGYLTGGQALAVASGEYNYEILEGLRLAVFADVGNAYDKDFKNDTKVGAGVGVRYASPVGQVRLDVATGVGEKDKSVKLHFFIGAPF